MPFSWCAALAVAVSLLASGAARAAETLAGPVPAKVVQVLDGDTLAVRARVWLGQDVEIRVRLAGVDTPELRGKCAAERQLARRARDFVRLRTAAGAVTLSEIRYGKFAGRVVARVATAEGDLGRALIAARLGRAYKGSRRVSWCPKSHAAAFPR